MTTSKILFFILLLSAFYSCKEDFDPLTDLNGTKNDIRAMLSAEDITQRVSLSSDTFRFVTAGGAVISAEPNAFVFLDGSPYAGDIDFEVTELYTKSQIIQYGLPTITSSDQILDSEGEFNFQASTDGRPLRLAAGQALTVQVPAEDQRPVDETELFFWEEGWTPVDSVEISITEFRVNQDLWGIGYEALIPEMKWVNFDYLAYEDVPNTAVVISLPEGYNKDNSMGLAVFSDRDIVLELGVDQDDNFTAVLPLEEVAHFVVIAALDADNFRYAASEETIVSDLVVSLDPKKTSEEEIKRRLAELD